MWERRQASVPVWSAVPLRKVHSVIAKFFLCITLSPPSTWTNVLNLQVHPSISVDSALILKGLQYKPSAWQPLSQACISNIWHLGSVTSDYQSVLKVKNACRGTKNNISSLTRVCVCVCVCARTRSVTQSCPTLCDLTNYRPPASSAHGILPARTQERVVIYYSRGSSRSRDQTGISGISCVGWQILYHWATWESLWFIVKTLYLSSLSHTLIAKYYQMFNIQ